MNLTRREIFFGIWGSVIGGISVGIGVSNNPLLPTSDRSARVRVTRGADDGWLLSDADRDGLRSADAIMTSEQLDLRDAVDLPGGDYSSFRAAGLTECVEVCEADGQCDAFTYARASHALPDKRRMCWLKTQDTADAVTGVTEYVSGRRDGW